MNEKPSRPFKKLRKPQIHIVEDHNEALRFIYSAIGGKKIPDQGNIMIHFDSHPDLLLPRNLPGEVARNGKEVLDHLQIENWILPAVAGGFISEVFWIRPSWSHQLDDGMRNFFVGDDSATSNLRVDAKETYFLSDALYHKNLINKNKLTLTVCEMKDFENAHIKPCYILDIDLDFITVNDPFEMLYDKVNLCKQLETLYNFKVPDTENEDDWVECNTKRETQLLELESLFSHLQKHRNLDTWSYSKTATYNTINSIREDILTKYSDDEIDWLLIHDAGCTRDHGGLPKHLSTVDEEIKIVGEMEQFLKKLPPPSVITIARSSDDDYCPKEAVERVQLLVVNMLNHIYDIESPPLLHYLCD